MTNQQPHVLDVRPILKEGKDPFAAIMSVKNTLAEGQELHLIAPFQPLPLVEVFQSEGYQSEMTQPHAGEWHIRFIPNAGVNKSLELDLRTLEPPEPLHRALRAVAGLGREETLVLHTRFRPVHLFEQLEEGRYDWECEEVGSGHWTTHLWRNTH